MAKTTKNVDQAKKLLKALLPSEKLYTDQLRVALLEAASLALQLLVASPDAEPIALGASKMRYIDISSLEKVKNLEFAKSLVPCVGNKPPSVVGFHVIDPEIGRYSQIWIPPSRSCPPPNGGGETQQNWWQAYPALWLRIYKQLLHPSTSLINAYERKLLRFRESGLLIHWDDNEITNFNETVVSLRGKCVKMNNFVDSTTKELNQFHNILLNCLNTSVQNEEEIQLIVENISFKLKEHNLLDALMDIRTEYLHEVIKKGPPRNVFLKTLKDIGGQYGDVFVQLHDNRDDDKWFGKSRRKAIEGIEILQTILFNTPGFCGKQGFLIARKEIADSLVYILLGRDGTFELDTKGYARVKGIFSVMALAITSLLKDTTLSKKYPPKTPKSDLVIKKALKQLKVSAFKKEVKFFLTFAKQLSLEAIHEGHELSFLLGFGHAEEPEIRCRNPIRLHRHLSRKEPEIDLLVHFVKSYFSLFGNEDRILWFNQYARCQGLYERAPQDPKERWLEGWPKDCYFVRIKGKGQLDILQNEITGASQNQHRPRVRIKSDEVVDLKSLTDIRYRVMVAAAQVFPSHPNQAWWVIELLTKVVDRLRETAHGAGLVIVNQEKDVEYPDPEKWRISIDDQVKSLVSGLGKFSGVKVRFNENNKEPKDDLINEICLLAELDGAVYLEFKKEEMCAYPARHFFPLVEESKHPNEKLQEDKNKIILVKENKQLENNRRLLDFYKWTEEYEKEPCKIEQLGNHLDKGLDKINNVLPRNLVDKSKFKDEFSKCDTALAPFAQLEILKLYAACIRGLPRQLIDQSPDNPVRKAIANLSFLTSSGTRHHSLWGITLSSKQRLFAVSLSQDGRVSVFWDGRFIPSIKPK